MIVRSALLLAAALLCGCSQDTASREGTVREDAWQALWQSSGPLDTLGVADLAEGDTTSGHRGLTVIESTVHIPAAAAPGAEIVAWEFDARVLSAIKLIVVRYDRSEERYELIGESQTVVPRRLGPNQYVLPEPIPVTPGCMYGIVMPDKETVPFRRVLSWKALIRTRGLERPFMARDSFATYGWRYSVRVFWRSAEQPREDTG